MIGADRNNPDLTNPHAVHLFDIDLSLANDQNAPFPQRVVSQGRNLTLARQLNGSTALKGKGDRLSDDLKALHRSTDQVS